MEHSKGSWIFRRRWNPIRGLDKFFGAALVLCPGDTPAFLGLSCEQEKSRGDFWRVVSSNIQRNLA